jgi:hypothetical protein
MSGQVIPVTPKRLVDFTGLATGTQDFILADRVPIPSWREVTLLVRIHFHNIGSGVGTITIMAAPQSWTPEDPGLTFLTAPSTGWTQIPPLTNTSPNPGYVTANFIMSGTNCTSAMTRLIARGTRTTAGNLSAIISVAFSAKDI